MHSASAGHDVGVNDVDDGGTDLFDASSRWRAGLVAALELDGIERCQALGAGPAFPSALTSVLRTFERARTSLIVDVGAGTGATSELTRQLTGADVVAIEPSFGSMEACRQLFPDVLVVAGTATSLPIADARADAALFNGVLSLIEDVGSVLHEAHRVLRAGGMIAITDLFLDLGYELHAAPNIFRSIELLISILSGHGFELVEVGIGSTDPRADWAGPQTAIDELTNEIYGDDPAHRAFSEDHAHLAKLVGRGILVGGCIAARKQP